MKIINMIELTTLYTKGVKVMVTKELINDVPIEKQRDFFKCINKNLSRKTRMKLYTMVYGWHFNEHVAKMAVENMFYCNSDGEKIGGESYTKSNTDSIARKMGLEFNHFNEWDWYYVMNMVASDYAVMIDSSAYPKIARAWLEDADVPEGKAFRYWCKVVMA